MRFRPPLGGKTQTHPSSSRIAPLMPPLGEYAFSKLSDFFASEQSPLKGMHREALQSFLGVLDQGLQGMLPQTYHLLSLDPGMGKTQACVHFLKAWSELGYQPASSVLVAVSTLDELKSFIAGTKLPREDFGVLTSDAKTNSLGLRESSHGRARVLFTTQAMIRSRTRGKLFTDADEFHFEGKPRSLRLWDENILPRAGVVLTRSDLFNLVDPLRADFPKLSQDLETFVVQLGNARAGSLVRIPLTLRLEPRWATGAFRRASQRENFDKLQLMVGSQMLVPPEQSSDIELVGVSPVLPSDFAPVVVVDASGRVRTTYERWSHSDGNLTRLPSAHNDYNPLRVRFWKKASGKDALTNQETLDAVASAIAEVIQAKPDEGWLIVTYKDRKDALSNAVTEALCDLRPANVRYLHWGKHLATNEFRDFPNIVLVGQWTYPQSAYLALALAASGQPIDPANLPDTFAVRAGEMRHHLLQGLCRASVRKASGGVAGACSAYIVNNMGDAERVIAEVFPGCHVSPWKDTNLPPDGLLARAMEYLQECFDGQELVSIPKRDFAAALGTSPGSLRNNVTKKDRFKDLMDEMGLMEKGRLILRQPCGFGSIEDGYVHVEQP